MSYNRLGVLRRLQYDTESRELAQCRGHGLFNVAAPQLHRPAGAKDQPALPYNWAGGRDMLHAIGFHHSFRCQARTMY